MTNSSSKNRRLLISCQVFQRELAECLPRATRQVDVQYLAMGVHGDTAEYAGNAIQAAIDAADADTYDHVLIGYGLCNYGVRGLTARQVPLVLPRTYDCISLLLGSRQKYRAMLQDKPSTYFQTSGWVDAAERGPVAPLGNVASRLGMGQDLQTLVDKYGEDNGRFLFDTLQPLAYARHVYLTTCTPDEPRLLNRCRENAEHAGCPLQVVEGTTRLLDALLQGPWDEDEFLVVPPGKQVELAFSDKLLCWKDPSP